MSASRILFWIALAVLVYFAVRSKLRSSGFFSASSAGKPSAKSAAGQIEAMACCAHCHVYFPISESLRADGEDYCSQAHVRLPPL